MTPRGGTCATCHAVRQVDVVRRGCGASHDASMVYGRGAPHQWSRRLHFGPGVRMCAAHAWGLFAELRELQDSRLPFGTYGICNTHLERVRALLELPRDLLEREEIRVPFNSARWGSRITAHGERSGCGTSSRCASPAAAGPVTDPPSPACTGDVHACAHAQRKAWRSWSRSDMRLPSSANLFFVACARMLALCASPVTGDLSRSDCASRKWLRRNPAGISYRAPPCDIGRVPISPVLFGVPIGLPVLSCVELKSLAGGAIS